MLSDLESQIHRFKGRNKELEDELDSAKDKNKLGEKQ
jgi:hypothetical protein